MLDPLTRGATTRESGMERGGGTGWTVLASHQERRALSVNVAGLAPASMLVHTQLQGGGGRGEEGMETTPPRARPTTLRSWDADMMTTTIVTVVLLPIRILALLLSLVDDNDDADVRMRMGGWGARGCCHRCLSARTLLNE